MPGVNLNLDIPTLSDTFTNAITKTAVALAAIQNDLTPLVTPSEINVNTPFQFNGNNIVNCGSVQLTTGSTGVPGTLAFQGGELGVQTGAGYVVITANGALNLASVGGIGGDYTTSSALVYYDSIGAEYRFYDGGATILSKLHAKNLILDNGSNKVTFGVDAAIGGDKTINIKSLPAALIGLIAYDAASNAVVSGVSNTITAATTFSGLVTVTNVNVSSATGLKHPDYSSEVGLQSLVTTGVTATQLQALSTGPGWSWTSQLLNGFGPKVGERIKTLLVNVTKGAGTITITLKKRIAGAAATTVQATTSTSTGTINVTLTVGAPVAIAANEKWYVQIDGPLSGDHIDGLTVTWDQV